ncbi:glycosyl hydrolases family 31-domain-containing protein [Fusarium tricinctum]|uniref:alpha-glucosidase n=1 Tax=Fusarium tricinctum TaxID=61284 RepID=A0A8K0RRA2_9HYPO|nr:glycosyl hydrolases family 31-domain-containing protein [Fusarium tricinctum]
MEGYTIPNKPLANKDSIVAGDQWRFTLINDIVLRYEWSEDGVFEDRPSTFALNREFPTPKFTVSDTSDQLEIRAEAFQVTYNKKRFDRYGLVISFTNKNTLWGADWRYGETPQNLGGTARTLDEVNGRCELEPGILSRAGYSVLDDSDSMLFDSSGFAAPRRPGDRIDGYLFSYGYNYKAAMKAFFAISGNQPRLPRWALGNWWSRYYPYTDDEYLKLMDKFEAEKVPLSVAVIDMDWHQVHGDHIPHAGWTGYTWNKELFKDPKAFTKALHDKKLKITLNDHPHGGVYHHEDQYEAMAKDLGHDTSDKAPILFNPVDPKFMHSYLNALHRSLENDGCDFWWIDWQQGPYSRVRGLDPLWLLNHYHFLDHEKQKGDGKAIIFSRFGGPGSHRYPVGFSGDSIMTWESLAFQPEFTATASNIGYGWWSHDIGGHMGGYRDDELATRWVQYGVFSPIMRLHSQNGLFTSKEPWLYRPEFTAVMNKFLQFRHRLIPYLYTMNCRSSSDGEPVVQPLYWKFPERDEAYERPNQYYFGSELMVAPVVSPRDKRTNHGAVDVWVPPGRHVDIFTGVIYDGDRDIKMHRSIKSMPVLAHEGAIIPLDGDVAPGNGGESPKHFEILVAIGKDGGISIEEEPDNSKNGGKDSSLTLGYTQASGSLSFEPKGKSWTFKFLSVMEVPKDFKVIGGSKDEEVSGIETRIDDYPNVPGLVVHIPELPGHYGNVSIKLGDDPILSVLDPLKRIQDLVLDYQMDMWTKAKLWGILTTSEPTVVKIGQLMAMGLDEVLLGPIMELLMADSRYRTSSK